MKKITLLLVLLTFFVSCDDSQLYKDSSAPVEKRVESLLKQMTTHEKLEQLNMMVLGKNTNINNFEDRDGLSFSPQTGAFIFFGTDVDIANALQKRAVEESRLGIPTLFGFDVIHGCRTLFPIPLAQACSWNRDLVYNSSRIAAKESYLSGLRWSFSPMLDVARDGRWGRVAESYGEDPYVNSENARLVVSGYQGENIADKYSIASCLKHFAGYAYSQAGRDYNPSAISELSFWETVMPPFQAAIETGALTVMSSFNDLNGVPTVANRELLTDVLRGKLGFDGFVVSDWRSIEQLIQQRYAVDSLDAGVKAIKAGNDMDMYDNIYVKYFPEALERGVLDMESIDQAVRNILSVKFRLGLFENPYTEKLEDSERYMASESRAVAKQFAEESMVLLKNSNNLLPLTKKVKRIALVGPLSKDKGNMMGTWRAHAQMSDVTSIYEGLTARYGKDVVIDYISGSSFTSNDKTIFAKLPKVIAKADVVVMAMGELNYWSGENGSKASLELPQSQQELILAAAKCKKPIVLLTSSGRPLALSTVEPYVDAILQIWQPGLYGGEAVASILSGDVNPSGRLAITFPYITEQIPIFYNTRQNARSFKGENFQKYKDAPVEPLYPFGYGLSYSTFEYSNPKTSATTFSANQKVTVSVDVTNSSKVDGQQTMFWYVDDVAASVTQPIKKLKYYEKGLIKAGETKTFSFEIIPSRDLSFVNAKGESILESGDFYILVGDQRIKITLL